MNEARRLRERGSGLLVLVVTLPFLLAVAASVSLLVVNGQRSVSRSHANMLAFYAADAAAQVANALVRSTGPDMQPTKLEETFDGHVATVAIDEVEDDLYRLTSTSVIRGESSTVVLWVNFQSTGGGPQSGFEVTLGDQASINGDLRVDLDSNARISGKDHDENGNELADQSTGKPGLGVHETPGGTSFNLKIKSNAEVDGVPQAIANDLSFNYDFLRDLRDDAQSNADVFVIGSKKLEDGDSGNFGSSSNPVVAYVSLGNKDSLTLDSNFEGHGVLVIDAGKNASFAMDSNARWHGVILFRAHSDPSTGNGPLVSLDSNATVIGTVQLLIDIAGTVANGHKQLSLDSNSQILYSSVTVGDVLGSGGGSSSTSATSFRTK